MSDQMPAPKQSLSGGAGRSLSGSRKRRDRGRAKSISDSTSSRRLSSARMMFLLFSAGLGVAIIALLMASDQQMYVVRFADSAPRGAVAGPGLLEAAPIPSSAIEPGTFSGTDANAILAEAAEFSEGRWLVAAVGEKQQLRRSLFSSAGQSSQPLNPDERLVSISSRAPQAVAGRIQAGDLVDVFVVSSGGLTGVIGQGIEVVMVSVVPSQFDSIASQQLTRPRDSFDDLAPSSPVPGTYVLRVPAARAADYISADVAGRIYLVLRGPTASDFAPVPRDLTTVICEGQPRSPACASLVDADSLESSSQFSPEPARPDGSSPTEETVSEDVVVVPIPPAQESGQ